LRAGLSEARARTLRAEDGQLLSGATVVDGLLHHVLSRMIDSRPRQQRDDTRAALVNAVEAGQAQRALVDEFDALEPRWTPPKVTGFEAQAA
jgi:hypothetical protein